MHSCDRPAQRILASPWGEWLVIWASPHLTVKVMTWVSGFFLPFCPFLRANLSDWIEALLFFTERSLHLSGRHGQVPKISLPGWESTCALWGLFFVLRFSLQTPKNSLAVICWVSLKVHFKVREGTSNICTCQALRVWRHLRVINSTCLEQCTLHRWCRTEKKGRDRQD